MTVSGHGNGSCGKILIKKEKRTLGLPCYIIIHPPQLISSKYQSRAFCLMAGVLLIEMIISY